MSTQHETLGKYVLLEKLATGGMAEVFLARGVGASGIGKFFAIKRILPQFADSPEFKDMFEDEAKIAVNLKHSNIVSIHEYAAEKNKLYIVMDYVEGRNLRQILNKLKKAPQVRFSTEQVVYIIGEACVGLDSAHRCIEGSTGRPLNITHRDISPQNLMVSFEGEVKIVDFGIAKAESQLDTTRAGTLKGKFGYMSPEQAEGQPVDLRTDIFSLGIVLWELLANERLFSANNEINTLRKIRDCQIPSLRKANPNIHSELERIVHKALARDRNLRYQTANALHRDLNRFLNRQYPDFSHDDVAVLMRNLFEEEILSLRQRLVDYAKLNPPGPRGSQPLDERTLLTPATNTTSLVVSDPSASFKLSDVITQPVTLSEVVEQPATLPNQPAAEAQSTQVQASETRTPAVGTLATQTASLQSSASTNATATAVVASEGTNSATSTDGVQQKPTVSLNILTESSPGTGRTFGSIPDRPAAQSLPAPTAPSALAVLDDKALDAEMKQDLHARVKAKLSSTLETEQLLSSPTSSSSRFNRESLRKSGEAKGSSAGARFATFAIFSVLCLSVYCYLAKYFTNQMSDAIAFTDPVLHDLHQALGISTSSGEFASHPGTNTTPTAKPAGANPTNQMSEDLNSLASSLIIISNPSGADILLNNKSTGLVTPSHLEVPSKEGFSITVRKKGYEDFKQTNVTREKLGHRLTANLQKLSLAYLNIDVFPPQDAFVIIDGQTLQTNRGQIKEVAIPADRPVKIRVENRSVKTYDEIVVTVPLDKRRNVQLSPRKPMRTPSSENAD